MPSRRTYSSSVLKYENGRVCVSAPPESYHGPQFERAMAQEQYWDSKGCTEVWDPSKPLSSVAARPDTYGRAHTYHGSTMEHQYSDPYKKRPNPYTARVKADYDAYKAPSEGHKHISKELRSCKNTNVGPNIYPEYDHRDRILEGKALAREGRHIANLAVQSRTGFEQKYPQAYEDREAIQRHIYQAGTQRQAAGKYRRNDTFLNGKLAEWKYQMEKQRGL